MSGTNSGKKFSKEWRKHLSESHKGNLVSEKTRRKMSKVAKEKGFGKWMIGKKHSKKTKKKMRLNNGRYWLGKKLSDEHKQKLSETHKGKKMTEEHKEKISRANKGKHIGIKNAAWRGGISFEPYSVDWTETLRQSIRERDHYICQLCGKPQGDKALSIHHIDYNKKNCNPDNLITLCSSCHLRTNFNRENWTKYFKNISIEGILLKK